MGRSERQGRSLRDKRVAILLADGFEFVELAIPRAALRRAGATVELISPSAGRVRGMNLTEPASRVAVDHTLDQADPGAYDALFVPGGFVGPDLLRQSSAARRFAQAMDAANKPIASLCHGPWLLISAGLVFGRTLTSWPGVRDDVVHAGGVWRDQPLVCDRNWVTSRGPQDLPVFVPAMLALFAQGAAAPLLTDVDFGLAAPSEASSPQAERPLALAVAGSRFLPSAALGTVVGVAAAMAAGALVRSQLD